MAQGQNVSEAFLADRNCLILEPSSSFANLVLQALLELGAAQKNIYLAKRYHQGLSALKEHKPCVIVSEYEVDGQFGLSLVEEQNQIVPDADERVFMVITNNAHDSAVAEAAEEAVDGYLLKPFSAGDLIERLREAVEEKANPTPYAKTIRRGKEFLEMGHFQEAERAFLSAKVLSDKPSLACYYAGQVSTLEKEYERALSRYREGREFNGLHYKCLLGEFDSLFSLKRYKDAYELVQTLTNYFPITPHRLGKIFITAVYTYNFDDIPEYYEIFKNFDRRPKELIRIMTAAALTGGKYFLREKRFEEADSYFHMAITISGRDKETIKIVIQLLLNGGRARSAEKFFQMLPNEMVGGEEHALIGFRIDQHILDEFKVVQKGKQLIKKGYADEDVYRTVIQAQVKMGRQVAAETIIIKAVKKYPDLRKELYDLLK